MTTRFADIRSADAQRAALTQIVWLMLLALAAAVYFVIRFGGRWADGDTAVMTQAIRDVTASGRLVPLEGDVYSNGFGYQAISAAILAFTGIDAVVLQQVVRPLISVALVLPAWVLFRELTGSGRLATLASLLLLVVPDHLFTVLRGSHELMTRALMLGALWMLVRANRHRADGPLYAIHLACALAGIFALSAINVVFGLSLVGALATALVGGWLLGRLSRRARAMSGVASPQLGWFAAAATVVVAAFLFFLYPPVSHTVRALGLIPAKLIELVTSGQTSSYDPYAGIATGWVSSTTYLLLSAGTYLLLAGSALVWLWLAWRWLRRGEQPAFGAWIAWLLYAGFAGQVGLGILADRAGLLGANFQLRALPMFAVLAVAIIAIGAERWRPTIRGRVVAGLGLAFLAFAGLLKASNEPTLSNRWGFYTQAEMLGLRWADDHRQNTAVWIGPDERLAAAYGVIVGRNQSGNQWAQGEVSTTTRAFLISDVVRMQSERFGQPLPPTGAMQLVYDNGTTRFYLPRSGAAFER